MLSRYLQDTSMRYFLEVVRTGSIAEASQRLNVAGSAISRHITQLEERLNVSLFERRPRGMVLSAAGELLANYAIKLAHDSERVAHDIQALQGLQRGRVRVATSEGFGMEFLPQLIATFQQGNPGVQFNLDVLAPAEVSRRVLQSDADIGLTFTLSVEKDICVELVRPAPIYAVMRKGHPLAAQKRISVSQMAAWPLALPAPDTTVRQLFDIVCSRKRVAISPALTSNYITGLFGFLRDHDGVTIASQISIRNQVARGELAAVALRDQGFAMRNLEVQTLAGRELPRAAQAFLKDLIGELSNETLSLP
ncbi:LysR family transcriptional regulator [Corticibacter populi]|uniref:LysR family transcriptional regulator n=1 Tax=Corticibacter populi TaxID=1550736 RepID=A0A3M6QWE9_9BURK|nr:LysR family transcriptional regulator [Corticibacter populi]RMX06919.1 LysR family transcriptional regulator [Corticibacter populi]